ncbi:MAG: hypothetical protein ABSH13_17140 [Candidatus Acidiferrum sp.]|jgi:type I restriction-modification system DNA methylase subunit
MRCDRTMQWVVPLLAAWGAVLLYSGVASAQDAQPPQDQSVADAARQAREAKKNAAKLAKVISDEDIDTKLKPGAEGLNVGSQPTTDAQPPSAAAVAAVEATDAAAAAAEKNPPVKPGENPEIARAKEQVVEVAKELDLLQRGYALDQDTYYSKPDYTDDHDGQAKLDAEKQQIAEKQQELDQAKAHVAELEAAWKAAKAASGESAAAPEAEKPAEAPASAAQPASTEPPPNPPQS